jgi:hypothetical protein
MAESKVARIRSSSHEPPDTARSAHGTPRTTASTEIQPGARARHRRDHTSPLPRKETRAWLARGLSEESGTPVSRSAGRDRRRHWLVVELSATCATRVAGSASPGSHRHA